MKQLLMSLVVCMMAVLSLRADEVKYVEVTLTEAGTLAQKLEQCNIMEVDSLIIKGPMNLDDCRSIAWTSSLFAIHHETTKSLSINLSGVLFPENTIPEYAFFAEPDNYDQYWDEYNYYAYDLGHFFANYLDIPSELSEIKEGAFCFSNIKHFPTTLPAGVTLDTGAFYASNYIELEKFFPEGMREIPDFCFFRAYFSNVINTPSTLRRIGTAAFQGNMMTLHEINLNEGLREIGDYAFTGADDSQHYLAQLIIPSTCLTLGEGAFTTVCTPKVVLPEGLREIPAYCFQSCIYIADITLPTSLRFIGDRAFSHGLMQRTMGDYSPIKNLEIPEGVYYIGIEAFEHAGFETFKFPSTTKTVGCGCLKDAVSGDILLAASTPPECVPHDMYPNEPIFEGLENHTLYVPVGASEAYRQAPGWCEFTDIREDPNLKDSSVTEVWNGDDGAPLYDLSGREVRNPQPGQICISRGIKVICQ